MGFCYFKWQYLNLTKPSLVAWKIYYNNIPLLSIIHSLKQLINWNNTHDTLCKQRDTQVKLTGPRGQVKDGNWNAIWTKKSKTNHLQVIECKPNSLNLQRTREEDRTHLYPQHNVPTTHWHKSFSASMSCNSTSATPHCITAQVLSIYLGWILHRHQGYLTSKPCQDTVSYCTTMWKKKTEREETTRRGRKRIQWED